jgi:CRP/FNR family transcriptional regulator, cyclic AMP receptor protein
VTATLADVSTVLQLTEGLPEVEYAPGDVVIAQGTRTGSIWILVSGSVHVRRDDQQISTISAPGAVFGEVSLLLDQEHGAMIVAAEPTVMRVAADGVRLFDDHVGFSRLVASDLARRLDALTIYLADVKRQYGNAPGIDMVSDVLQQLSRLPASSARPVSARDPDPEY